MTDLSLPSTLLIPATFGFLSFFGPSTLRWPYVPVQPATFNSLYWSNGDGGSQTDPLNNGQNTGNLLSTMVRIDVSQGSDEYQIPNGNIGGEELQTRVGGGGFSAAPLNAD